MPADDLIEEKPRVTRAPDYKAFYTNHAQVGFTQFDVFAILSEASSDWDNTGLLEQRARVTMSPVQAILLSRFLVNAVNQYEKVMKQRIQVPSGLMAEGEDNSEGEQGGSEFSVAEGEENG